MNIVYVHGLDSDANSNKGLLLESYCQENYPNIKVHRPDLNQAPEEVFSYLTGLVTELRQEAKAVLIGSSLGGYFSTLVSNHTGCGALLLNPSTQPHITLQRFKNDVSQNNLTSSSDDDSNTILYTTTGGWAITKTDLLWFAEHHLLSIANPSKVVALIKEGDELLNASFSAKFYSEQGSRVILQKGGDHRFSDFAEHLPEVMGLVQQLSS
ncbi:YqiA/YcfP family alpha/beta fold hydrolase [Psychrobacter sp. 1U2]|uniref:YqiA/YcfP family alpha/beta fold hydrolase n=1 Tax=Psychrobacter sp. 1U2 TaxID=3453577 RepID=UPI003F45F977